VAFKGGWSKANRNKQEQTKAYKSTKQASVSRFCPSFASFIHVFHGLAAKFVQIQGPSLTILGMSSARFVP
jgi:hypothetical protein